TREALLALLHELARSGAPPPTQAPLDFDATVPPRGPAPPAPEASVRIDPELRQEVPAFLDSRRRMVDTMHSALAACARDPLRTVAHRAAGGLALFGFQWAAWQSRAISSRAAQGDALALQ